MEKKKPTIQEIQEYLDKYNPLNLSGGSISLINEHNHLHYRVEKDGKSYCLRMINPEGYRQGEWVGMPEEYVILKYLKGTGLGPKPYFVDPERFTLPLMIQEFVSGAVCFNDLKPLSNEHLVATAQTIALLNSQEITPERFPFRAGYTRYSYLTSVKTWRKRLGGIKKSEQKDVLEWAEKIEAIVDQTEKTLEGFEPLLKKASFAFNFDGAHCGNTYWKNNKVIFLDWQKVSYGDPAFTLVRFLTSIDETGKVSASDKETMVRAYLEKREVPEFSQLVDQRLFERQVADLVWILWNYIREKKSESVEQAIGIVSRYERIIKCKK